MQQNMLFDYEIVNGYSLGQLAAYVKNYLNEQWQIASPMLTFETPEEGRVFAQAMIKPTMIMPQNSINPDEQPPAALTEEQKRQLIERKVEAFDKELSTYTRDLLEVNNINLIYDGEHFFADVKDGKSVEITSGADVVALIKAGKFVPTDLQDEKIMVEVAAGLLEMDKIKC